MTLLKVKNKTYTTEELQAMPIDVLDKLAFGYTNDEMATFKTEDLSIKYECDVANPEHRFAQGGMVWVRSVSFDEPIEVSITTPGCIEIEDGHHRFFAAQKLGKPITAIVTIKGNPVKIIIDRQDKNNLKSKNRGLDEGPSR